MTRIAPRRRPGSLPRTLPGIDPVAALVQTFNGMPRAQPSYDCIVLDEVQDLTAVQLALVPACLAAAAAPNAPAAGAPQGAC